MCGVVVNSSQLRPKFNPRLVLLHSVFLCVCNVDLHYNCI